MIPADGPQKTIFGRPSTLGGLGTLAATGNPDAQGQAAGLRTLGGLGTLPTTSKHPAVHPMRQKRTPLGHPGGDGKSWSAGEIA